MMKALLLIIASSFMGSFLGTLSALSVISWIRFSKSSKDNHAARMSAIEEGKLRILR